MGKTIYIHTLGCPKNTADSEKLRDRLSLEGINVVEGLQGSPDIVLINTCGFIQEAKRQSIEEILRLSKIIKRTCNGRRLCVFGCLAKRYKDELKKEMPEIDEIWGLGEEDRIVEYCIRESGTPAAGVCNSDTAGVSNPLYAYLKIAEGCDRKCSYCVIPSIKGSFKSIMPHEILSQAESFIKAGRKELVLISEDTASYGKDIKGYDLRDLIRDISSISGDFWIRLLYLNPASFNDKLIEVISDVDKVCKYLDIPLQHSEDRILRLMKRGGSKRTYKGLINKLRASVRGLALRSTFIVGFPGETEEDFKGLKDFIEEMQFEHVGVFKYSKEQGTPSVDMKGHVREKIKEARLDEMMRLQSLISLKKNKSLIGRTMTALIDEPHTARIYSQAPEIDGVVLLGPETPHASSFINVRITDAFDYDLIGETVK